MISISGILRSLAQIEDLDEWKFMAMILNIFASIVAVNLFCAGKSQLSDWICDMFSISLDPTYRLVTEALVIPAVLGLKIGLARLPPPGPQYLISSKGPTPIFIVSFLDTLGRVLFFSYFLMNQALFCDWFCYTFGISVKPEKRTATEMQVMSSIFILGQMIQLLVTEKEKEKKNEEEKRKNDEGKERETETGQDDEGKGEEIGGEEKEEETGGDEGEETPVNAEMEDETEKETIGDKKQSEETGERMEEGEAIDGNGTNDDDQETGTKKADGEDKEEGTEKTSEETEKENEELKDQREDKVVMEGNGKKEDGQVLEQVEEFEEAN